MIIQWQGYDWNIPEKEWELAHYDYPYKWYDKSCVKIGINGELKLSTKFNPKTINLSVNGGSKVIHPKTGIGIVTCNYPFHFGDYEIIAKLPKGDYLWPAIWLYDLNVWPPEIDIIEAYSNKKCSYWKWKWPFYRIESNFHYKENNVKKSAGNISMYSGLCNPTNRFIKFEMKWREDYISILVNGKERRKITGEIMKFYQNPMKFILNSGIQKNHNPTSNVSDFIIKSFKYNPY